MLFAKAGRLKKLFPLYYKMHIDLVPPSINTTPFLSSYHGDHFCFQNYSAKRICVFYSKHILFPKKICLKMKPYTINIRGRHKFSIFFLLRKFIWFVNCHLLITNMGKIPGWVRVGSQKGNGVAPITVGSDSYF